jgi:glycosyltransferase involved in cell wall biosynthesis
VPQSRTTTPIDVVLPAHNEADCIATTLRDFFEAVSRLTNAPIRFVVSEDGSTDNTVDVLRALSNELPIELLTFPERKGYSRAVVDGLQATTADVVAFIDADGQCDPEDFPRLLEALEEADLVVGYRSPRRDPPYRKAMSAAFKFAYRLMFPVRLRDPSCPFLVIRRPGLARVLKGRPGLLEQGFWWEFNARAMARGLSITEIPVGHRARSAGSTKVYRPGRIPRIALEHVRGLFALRRELATLSSDTSA